MLTMKDGAILANAGHFDTEIDMAELRKKATSIRESRENITAFVLENGKTVHVLAEGRLVNIAASNGHPAEIMDLSFAVQAMSAMYIKDNYKMLPNDVVDVSDKIDDQIARMKLASWGVEIDTLTKEQEEYLKSWDV